ncbi:MBL fold metallo-hydrolase [Hamadaea sp. NPDC051192]|uniref:MBL fold metallo-hydrolase n=1 Tax=Hamadaea sp. NPDC051192 TaxID=3154940 RepID=UPI00344756D1
MTSSRRRFIGSAALVGTGAALAGAGAPAAAASPARRTAPGTAGATGASAKATFRWLGTSGWRIDIGDKTLLVDPYLSRYSTGLFAGHFDPATELTVDEGRIGDHPGTPETILVTHTHWDHYNDVPHIAQRSGARVFGTLTAYHLGLAYQVPAGQLSPVKGGEVMDFGAYTVEVAGSLHSRNGSYSLAFPGVRVAVPPRPRTVQDLPEGDTLAYQVSVAGGPKVFFMGASDFAERNLTGLAPDVAMIAVPATDVTHAYVPRLLAALDHPAVVVPVHWDDFETALQNPPSVSVSDRQRLDLFVAAVRATAPRTRILVPEYLRPYTF